MKRKIRKTSLVVDTRMINSSGIGVYLKNILPEIALKFELTLLGSTKELSNFSWTRELKIIEFTPKIYSFKEQVLYPFVIPRSTLFWCPHFNAPILPIRAKRLLTTIYDVNHLANRQSTSFLKRVYAKMLYNIAVKKSKKIITISKFSKSELLKFTLAKKEKISIIYCGVDYEFFAEERNNINHEITGKYILYVGNVKPHKNLIVLLKAYKELPKSVRSAYKLVILGKKEGFITPDLEVFQFIDKNHLLEDIIFTGYLEDKDVPLVYQKASLFVFPSLYEGFGLPILEAMVSGVPVLTSNATSLPEVGGDAVIYFNPKDYKELSDKITAFLSNYELSQTYVEKGKLQAKLFSWEPAQKKHIQIIKQLLDKEKSHAKT